MSVEQRMTQDEIDRVMCAINVYAQAWQDAGAHSFDAINDDQWEEQWGRPLERARQEVADALCITLAEARGLC